MHCFFFFISIPTRISAVYFIIMTRKSTHQFLNVYKKLQQKASISFLHNFRNGFHVANSVKRINPQQWFNFIVLTIQHIIFSKFSFTLLQMQNIGLKAFIELRFFFFFFNLHSSTQRFKEIKEGAWIVAENETASLVYSTCSLASR